MTTQLISFPSNYRPRVLEERIRRSHQKQLEVQIEALNRARKTDGGPRTIHEKILLRQQAAEAKAAEEAAIAAAAAEVEASNNSNTHSGSNSANMSGCGGDGTPRRSRLPSMSHAENADFNSGAGGATGTSTRNGTPSSRQHQQTGPPSSSSPFPRNHSADLGGGDDGAGGDTTASNPSAVGTADFEGGNDAELMTSRSETQKMSSTKSSIAAGGGGGTGGSSSSRQSSGRLNSAPTGDATTTDVSGINSSLGAQSNSRSLMALAEEDSTKSAGFVGALLGSASVKAQHSSSALLRRESEGSTSTADATAVSIPVPAPTEGSGADVTSERQASAHLETHQDHQDISEMTQQTISSEDEKNHMSESGAEEKKKEEETPTEASGSEERRVIFEMSEEASLSAVDISGMSTIASSPMKSERLKASPTSSDTVSKPSTPLGGRKGQELAKAKESDSYYEAQLSEKPLMLLAEEEATSASNPDNSLQESALLQVSDSVEAEMPLPTTA